MKDKCDGHTLILHILSTKIMQHSEDFISKIFKFQKTLKFHKLFNIRISENFGYLNDNEIENRF